MMVRSLMLLLGIACLMGCRSTVETEKLQGLWELEVFEVDGVEEPHSPYFLQMNPDGSFAVAKRTGDVRGFYDINGSQILFKSTDVVWFNKQWALEILREKIRLTGKGYYGKTPYYSGYRQGFLNTRLTFTPVESIPSFQAFEDAIQGRWELYKIREKGDSEQLTDTWMKIENGEYAIAGPDHYESGAATINTRYRKVYFQGHNTAWDAWFFGEELRLSNNAMELIYNLRKSR
ncbi:MAG: hypothetical protein R8G66_04955 [Cytophagales bacterium]|nr:hypothetical protein [Cytophagales bacterium]